MITAGDARNIANLGSETALQEVESIIVNTANAGITVVILTKYSFAGATEYDSTQTYIVEKLVDNGFTIKQLEEGLEISW